jgi:hypothetical protein
MNILDFWPKGRLWRNRQRFNQTDSTFILSISAQRNKVRVKNREMTIVVDFFDNYFNCGYFITYSFSARSDGLACGSEATEIAYSADASAASRNKTDSSDRMQAAELSYRSRRPAAATKQARGSSLRLKTTPHRRAGESWKSGCYVAYPLASLYGGPPSENHNGLRPNCARLSMNSIASCGLGT